MEYLYHNKQLNEKTPTSIIITANSENEAKTILIRTTKYPKEWELLEKEE